MCSLTRLMKPPLMTSKYPLTEECGFELCNAKDQLLLY